MVFRNPKKSKPSFRIPRAGRLDIPDRKVLLFKEENSVSQAMSDYLLTSSGSVIDFSPMAKGLWPRIFSSGSWAPWMGTPDSLLGSRPISEKEAIRLTNPENWVNESAAATFDLLLKGIHDTKIIDSMCDCYNRYLKLYGGKNSREKYKIAPSDRARILFEILCFTTYIIVVRVVPGYIKRKFSAVNHASLSHYICRFNQSLLDRLDGFLSARKIPAVRARVIIGTRYLVNFGPNEPMDAAKRLSCYLRAGSIEEELRLFSESVGGTIDRADLEITEVIGLSHTGTVLDIISRSLNTVFKK